MSARHRTRCNHLRLAVSADRGESLTSARSCFATRVPEQTVRGLPLLVFSEHSEPRLDVAAHVHVPVQDADDLHHARAHPIEHHMRTDGDLAVSGPDVFR